MHILLIGGTRFIGPAVVRALQAQGHDITVFHRGQTSPHGLPDLQDVRYVHGNRRQLAEHATELRRLAPDAVVDMIPMSERDAQGVMDVFNGHAGHVVAISSMDVYRAFGRLTGRDPGPPDPIPFAEAGPLREQLYPFRLAEARPADHPAQWMDDYDKIVVERIVLGNPGLPGTALRLPIVFGPGDNQRRLYPYLKRMDDGRPAILLGETESRWQVSRGYVDNVAEAVACAVGNPAAFGNVYNVADDDVQTEQQWLTAIGRVAGWDGRVVVTPDTAEPGPDLSHHLVADTARIRRELGYTDRIGLDEAIARTIAWDRAYPPDNIDPAQFDYADEDRQLAQLADGSET